MRRWQPAQGWSASGRSGQLNKLHYVLRVRLNSKKTNKLYKGFTSDLREEKFLKSGKGKERLNYLFRRTLDKK